MTTPYISNARVIAVDVAHRRLTVTLPSTQVVIVRMGYAGPADGLRVSHKAMPGRGTEGIVVFPGRDNRNGFWLASIYVSAMDALTTDTDQFLEYDSHWSGHYHLLDQIGNFTESFADGSFLQIGSGTTPPPTSRHTVDATQHRQTTPVSQSERVPSPPSPFNATFRHISGTKMAIDPKGDTSVVGASGATLTQTFGGTTLEIDASGNTSIIGASGAALKQTFGGTTLEIDAGGNLSATGGPGAVLTLVFGGTSLTINSAGVFVNNALGAAGEITAGAGGSGSVTLLAHRHGTTGTVAASTIAPTPGT